MEIYVLGFEHTLINPSPRDRTVRDTAKCPILKLWEISLSTEYFSSKPKLNHNYTTYLSYTYHLLK